MKKKYKRVIILILMVMVVLLLALLLRSCPKDTKGIGVTFEPNTGGGEQVSAGTTLPGITIPGWTSVKLPSQSTEADISLHNPETNEGYYSLSFTLKLADTGETIFTTGPIEPGYKCTHVALNRKLESGVYDAVLFVQPYLLDEKQTPTNNAELEILLIVE